MVRRIDKESGESSEVLFTLADVGNLEEALKKLPDCKLIVIDPIGSFIGGSVDSYKDNEVRGVLAPVAMLAGKYGPAVLVVAHTRKAGGKHADDLAMGSRAFTGIARASWHLTRDEQDKGRRLLLPGKNNLASQADGLAFRIEGEPARLVWESEPIPMHADDVLALENERGEPRKPGPDPIARNNAAEWLRELLSSGPMEVGDVRNEAQAAGYSWRTVERAKDSLSIKSERRAFGEKWRWVLPDDSAGPRYSPSPPRLK
jgi:hypothetical protein